MKKMILAISLLLSSSCILADEVRAEKGRELSAGCTVCHGTDGMSRHGSIPSLHGIKADLLIKKINESRGLVSGAMASISNGYTDDEIQSIALFFENKKSK